MSVQQDKRQAVRRRFLQRAGLATGSAAALGFPSIVRAQGPIIMRWQSTWPAKDIFHEYANDFAKKVNGMTGGDLKIEVLPAGAVVPAFGLLEAVSKGSLDGCHGVLENHYSRHDALALWSCGPAFGMDANTLLAWHKYGGGKALLAKIYASIGANVVSFLHGPMPTQPLGWFQRPITRPDDFNGLKFRAVGMAIEVYAGLGAKVNALPAGDIVAALERGVLDGAEYNNAASDRLLGLAGVAKVYMLQSYHQSAEQLEILLNKPKFDALPPKLKAIIESAVEAASADVSWRAIDRYSKDYAELRSKDGVRTLRTPDTVLRRQLAAFDAAARKRQNSALFREVQESQRGFAERAVRWFLDTQVSPRIAHDHYFDRKPPARGKK